MTTRIGAVIIGRNEGARLEHCLSSVTTALGPSGGITIYVDSGSTDASLEAAGAAGAQIVELDMAQPFTAARARNEGFATLEKAGIVDLVQFIDGDCEMQPGWIPAAQAFLSANQTVAVVCGRRRERFPRHSVYNRLCDWEWDTPVGEARACGGDALMRAEAFRAVGGFNPDLIAGEEPELCVRLRQAGWKIWRLDQEMTLHDAAMIRFGQWWQRSRRAGHAFAEGAALHGAPPERHWVAETWRALLWGAALPFVTLLGLLVTPWALLLLLVWPLHILRMRARGMPAECAALLAFGKIAEAAGVLEYHARRLTRRRGQIIEYK